MDPTGARRERGPFEASRIIGSRAETTLQTRHRTRLLTTSGWLLAATGLAAATVTGSTVADEHATEVTADAEVESIIELTADEEAFTLEEVAGETATVTSQLTATTNSVSGYTVIVEADDVELLPSDTDANADSIPIEALSVQGNNFTVDRGLLNLGLLGEAVEPLDVHSQGARSADGGDTVIVDYAMQMPSVNVDTYSVGLIFTAATND